MPYEVLENVLTVHKPLNKLTNKKGESEFWDVAPITYFVGDIIPDEDVAPYIVEAYDAGDEHTTSVLKRIDSKPKVEDSKPKSVKKEATPRKSKDSSQGEK